MALTHRFFSTRAFPKRVALNRVHLMASNPFIRLGAERSAMRCIGQAMQRTRCAAMTYPKGRALFPAGYVARRLWYMYHGATRALSAEKIAPVKWVAVTEIW